MPEDDRGPVAAHLVDLGAAKMQPGCVRLEADGLAAMPQEGPDQGPVACTHVKNRAWRQHTIEPGGQRATGAAEHCIADAGEPARRGPVPGAVCLVQLARARPWRRSSHTAPGAPDPAGTAVVGSVELVLAPRALGGSGRQGT